MIIQPECYIPQSVMYAIFERSDILRKANGKIQIGIESGITNGKEGAVYMYKEITDPNHSIIGIIDSETTPISFYEEKCTIIESKFDLYYILQVNKYTKRYLFIFNPTLEYFLIKVAESCKFDLNETKHQKLKRKLNSKSLTPTEHIHEKSVEVRPLAVELTKKLLSRRAPMIVELKQDLSKLLTPNP